LINRYNSKVQKIFLDAIEDERIIEDNYFVRDKSALEVVQKYNKLISIRGDIMKQSSSLEKRHEQFIADSIHQLKTPLSAIMINLDLIEMSIDTKDIDQFISQMKTSIDMLTLTYEELSYLSMNNSIEYKKTYLNLSEIIQQRLDFFKQIAVNNDKKIVSTVLSNLYTTINKIEFERIVDNNLINAIKYSKSNSLIEVSFIKEDDTYYKFVISSQGNEIKNSENIFKRHYREEEGKRGHGLGLAITKEICDKYDIDIKYKREEDKNIFQYLLKVT
jgi:signal transduction histidine kinase